MQLNATTEQKLMQYAEDTAKHNKVDCSRVLSGLSYSIDPSVQQKLEKEVLLKSDFLKRINIVPVTELKGETLRLGVASTIASRTDTSVGSAVRVPENIMGMEQQDYECFQTNFDTFISFAQLDTWAKFPDFGKRIGDLKAKRIALDRIMIGWNGTQAAKTTNRTSNPLLQDVNKGWLQLIRENAAESVLTQDKTKDGKIIVNVNKGDKNTAEYKTLDGLVYAATSDLIAEEFQDETNLVAIMSRDLLTDKYFPLQNDPTATEKLAGDTIISQKRVGGLPAVTVPYFPKKTILITSLDNLSIYYQDGKMRRLWKEHAEANRYEDFMSSNEAYVVENYKAVALIENIHLVDEDKARAEITIEG
ncbi:phage major capsid protein, P2 family [Phocoenobacter uteri]|uniref:Phage major capsid protein, P2 family n=1 Tax=Phocoenobacter uteri TaxID=146806 RepID=A0A379C9K6_9PAST|nr:phage major capsid protein, P2 family [Phocoenobacter uteri]MDG6881043.1 capsid protein [Phocoenobacter uteri]SUB59062.1 phage major capsid protein, P2 family [Phocoenobacter uteri]